MVREFVRGLMLVALALTGASLPAKADDIAKAVAVTPSVLAGGRSLQVGSGIAENSILSAVDPTFNYLANVRIKSGDNSVENNFSEVKVAAEPSRPPGLPTPDPSPPPVTSLVGGPFFGAPVNTQALPPAPPQHPALLWGAAAGVSATCSAGTPYTVAMGDGLASTGSMQRRMSHGADRMTYGLYKDVSRSSAWGSAGGNRSSATGSGIAQPFTVYGRIPSQVTPPAGTYTDTVVVTVSY